MVELQNEMLFLWFLMIFLVDTVFFGLSGQLSRLISCFGQAQISKLEADLTNALEVAKVAEAAAARFKIVLEDG